MASVADETITIVGGGITGLFCAYVLARNNARVHLFEASGRPGGRILSARLRRDNTPCGPNWHRDELEFCAEFGPMRIELDKQLLVKALLDHLSITAIKHTAGTRGAGAAYLDVFPAYASPGMASDPKYNVRPEEVGKTPLELLRMAMLRIVARLEVDDGCEFARRKRELVARIAVGTATREPVETIFDEWMRGLTENDYWEIQTRGRVDGVPLYAMGFWNLLSDCLSHDAITMLRDLGTFYHLLPENPNAAEWLVWWLLGFAISQQLQGVFGGMECIIDLLVRKLDEHGVRRGEQWFTGAKVAKVSRDQGAGKFRLEFDEKTPTGAVRAGADGYDRVILALTKSAVQRILHPSGPAFAAEPEIHRLLDSAFGFPMVKMFVVVKNRWWEEANRANLYATRLPTRELHYWKGHTLDSKQGMIMLYTDRPASSFWSNYVAPGEQTDFAGMPPGHALAPPLRDRLIKKVVRYLRDNGVPDITAEDVVWYGIRDWGREPFGGGNHAWRPERRYWVVMRRLAEIADHPGRTPSLHVCGEAYSDYHGFMEGSLRSGAYVLHRILHRDGTNPILGWLADAGLMVRPDYLASLRNWATSLDGIPPTEPFLWSGSEVGEATCGQAAGRAGQA